MRTTKIVCPECGAGFDKQTRFSEAGYAYTRYVCDTAQCDGGYIKPH